MTRTLHLLFFILITIGYSFSQTAITIAEARQANADGVLERLDEEVILEGKALGPNFRPEGLTFALYDVQEGIGITVFSLDDNLGYDIVDFQNIRVTGTLAQFNGLAEIVPSAIEILGAGGFNPSTGIITQLDETTESKIVVYKDAMLVDPSQWADSGSFNIDVTNGTTTIQVRIDSDIDISGMPAPTGTFDITGIGGQFDAEPPYDSGYQLFPRSISDIDPYNPGNTGPIYAQVTMAEIRENDANGIPVLNEELVEVNSIVYGVNLRPGGLQFTIIDENNQGVAIFSNSEQFGYTVTEGDRINVQGTLGHFNGLTQITPDTLWWVSSDNELVEPRLVTALDETTESSLVEFFVNGVVDASAWAGDGSSFNLEYLDETGAPFTIRIDNDTYWSTQAYPGDAGLICRGIGGQFDNDDPRDSGYQMLPRYESDLTDMWLSTFDLEDFSVSLFPNPTTSYIEVDADNQIESLSIYSLTGQLLNTVSDSKIDMSGLDSGNYYLQISSKRGSTFRKVAKI